MTENKTKPLNIIFMGSSDFAVPALEALYRWPGCEVKLALVQPDRPNRRGNKTMPLPVKQKALELGIDVYQPENVSKEGEEKLKALEPDLMVVAAYGQILRKNILDLPKYGTLNIHGSVLPHLRGAAPVHHAILNGDDLSGISIMLLDEGMDTGDVLSDQTTPITDETTVGELHDRLADMGAELLIETIPGYINGEILPFKQDASKADYADKVDKETGRIDFHAPVKSLIRRINGTDPFPGAFAFLEENGKQIKLFSPKKYSDSTTKEPGTIVKANQKEGLVIQAEDGEIEIGAVQLAGKKKMPVFEFFKGNHLSAGSKILPKL